MRQKQLDKKNFPDNLFKDPFRGFGEVSRGDKMLYSGTDPESYITEHTLVYED